MPSIPPFFKFTSLLTILHIDFQIAFKIKWVLPYKRFDDDNNVHIWVLDFRTVYLIIQKQYIHLISMPFSHSKINIALKAVSNIS